MKTGHHNHCRPSSKACLDPNTQLDGDAAGVEIPVADPLGTVFLTQKLDRTTKVGGRVAGGFVESRKLGIRDADPSMWIMFKVPQPIRGAVGRRPAMNTARVRRGRALAGA